MSNLLILSVRFPCLSNEIADKLTDQINSVALTKRESLLAMHISAFTSKSVVIKNDDSTTYISADLMLIIKRDHFDLFSSSPQALKLALLIVSDEFNVTERDVMHSKIIDVSESLMKRETATDSVVSEDELIDGLKALAVTAEQKWINQESLTLVESHNLHTVQHVCLKAA